MKNTKKKINILLACILLIAALFPANVFAAGSIDLSKKNELTVVYPDSGEPIPNAPISVYKVASVDEFGYFHLTDDFKPYEASLTGLSSINSPEFAKYTNLASTLKPYVYTDGLKPEAEGVTDENGELTMQLDAGLYLLTGDMITSEDRIEYTPTPCFFRLPVVDETNSWVYAQKVGVKPVINPLPPEPVEDDTVSISVRKVWDDEGFETIRPESASVDLIGIKDSAVVSRETVTLNSANNWKFTWDELSSECEWLVAEHLMDNYTVTVEGSGDTYLVNNKYSIISVDPPVQKKLKGDKPREAAEFKFTMTAQDPSFPMPAGSKNGVKEMTIKGAGSKEFGEIFFTKPGKYVYTIEEVNTGLRGYSYDTTIYVLTFDVVRNGSKLEYTHTITNEKGAEQSGIVFTNEYSSSGILPQTGVLWWPVPVLICLGLVCIIIGAVRKRYDR